MRIPLKTIKWRDVVPRIVADFIIIHCAMAIAFAVSMAYQSRADEWLNTSNLASAFRRYYFSSFLLFSTLFAAVFFFNGLYIPVIFYPARAALDRVQGVQFS